MPLRPENLLKAIYDNLPNPVIVADTDRVILSVNAAFVRAFGYQADEVIGKSAQILYAEEEDFHNFGESLFRADVAWRPGNLRICFRRKDGSSFLSDTVASQIIDANQKICGFVGVVHDLSAIIEMDEKQRKLEHILDDALDTMPEGYVVYDENDRLILCNRSYRQLYTKCAPAMTPGATFESVLRYGLANGQFPAAGASPQQQEAWIKDRLAYHHKPTGSVLRPIGDGQWVKIEDKVTSHGYRVGIRTDVTDLKRAQDELRETNIELERKNDALRQFAAIVSHDLQAPLRHISMFAAMLEEEGPNGPDSEDYIARISSAVLRMQRMIASLLEYSKVAYREVQAIPVDGRKLIEEAVKLLESSTTSVRDHVRHDNLPTVHGDRELLTLVFRNLIGNAMKYRGDAEPEIVISAERGESSVEFSVTDNGIGIDPQFADRIFVAFKRLHESEEVYEGTGIGLSLCQRIITSHGGRIWLDTAYAGGARFRFTLPDRAKTEPRPGAVAVSG